MARSARSRLLLVSGIVLLLGGMVVGGYVGWQLWGTDVVSERRHAAITQQLEEAWRSGSTTAPVTEGEAASLVRIPTFGRDYVVPVLEGTSDAELASGYGHFSGTADPGEIGNFALAAHRVTHGEPLRRMPELQVGDEVVVDTARTRYTYELISAGDALRVSFTDVWVINPVPDNPDPDGVEPPQRPERLLTLTTCAELFHTEERLIAFGRLVDRQPLRHASG